MPESAASPIIAETVTAVAPTSLALWLPGIIMLSGIVVLGALLMAMFHRRERQLKAMSASIASDLEEARALRQQLDDTHMRASTMMAAAQRLTARLDERLASLDNASLRMNATRNALPKTAAAALRSSPAAATPPMSFDMPAGHSAKALPASAATIEAKPGPDPLTSKVYDLADAGRSPLAIARDLNEHPGKIELILALRQRD